MRLIGIVIDFYFTQRTHWFWVVTFTNSSNATLPSPVGNNSSVLDPRYTNLTSLDPAYTNPIYPDLGSTISTSLDLPGAKNRSNTSYSFQELMEKVSAYLVEGIQGVLIAMPELDVDSPGRQER